MKVGLNKIFVFGILVFCFYSSPVCGLVLFDTDYEFETPFDLGLLEITSEGELIIRNGYSWDGPSGPTIDTKNFMQGSLIHDALCQLMREIILPQSARESR